MSMWIQGRSVHSRSIYSDNHIDCLIQGTASLSGNQLPSHLLAVANPLCPCFLSRTLAEFGGTQYPLGWGRTFSVYSISLRVSHTALFVSVDYVERKVLLVSFLPNGPAIHALVKASQSVATFTAKIFLATYWQEQGCLRFPKVCVSITVYLKGFEPSISIRHTGSA
jgi:hypothetical protein